MGMDSEIVADFIDYEAKYKRLEAIVKAWVEKHKSHCAEDLYQNDDCIIDAPDLTYEVIKEMNLWHKLDDC